MSGQVVSFAIRDRTRKVPCPALTGSESLPNLHESQSRPQRRRSAVVRVL